MTDQAKTIDLSVAQARVEDRKYPRVTKESIEAKIGNADYIINGVLTICIITMRSGFVQVGKAAPADPRNYDREVGQRYAYEDAFRGLWALEGYLLCEDLHVRQLPQINITQAQKREEAVATRHAQEQSVMAGSLESTGTIVSNAIVEGGNPGAV